MQCSLGLLTPPMDDGQAELQGPAGRVFSDSPQLEPRLRPVVPDALARAQPHVCMKTPANLVSTAAVTENLLKRRWSVNILRHLGNSPTDPVSICKLESGLTPSAVNERIRTMQRYGLITRLHQRTAAKIVHYEITDRGRKILKMLTLIEELDQCNKPEEVVLTENPRSQTPPAQPKKRPRRP